jgi:hypothetical protein
METLKKWWNIIVLYFATLDAEPEQKKKEKAPTEEVINATKTTKKVAKAKEVSVKASTAIKMITKSIEDEKDSGKKKYKSRLLRELNKAVEAKNKESVTKCILRIVNYLNK